MIALSTIFMFMRIFESTVLLISSTGVILNVLTCIAMIRGNTGFTSRLKITLSLTVSDLMLSLIGTVRAIQFTDMDIGNKKPYKIAQSIAYLSGTFNLVALGVDLLIAVCVPLKYKIIMSKGKGNLLVATVWIASVAMTAVSGYLQFGLEQCEVIWKTGCLALTFSVFSVLGLLVIVVIYTIVFCSLRKRMPGSTRSRSNKKAAITLFLIVLTYFLFVLPRTSMELLVNVVKFRHVDDTTIFYVLILLTDIFIFINSVCDPLIYSKRLPEVQKFFRYD